MTSYCSSQQLNAICPAQSGATGFQERKRITLIPDCKDIEEKFGITPWQPRLEPSSAGILVAS